MSANNFAVDIKNASFLYGKLKALDNLSLQVPRGLSFGLLGPNGAGKTTLIRVLVGLLQPSAGDVRIMGQAPGRKIAPLIGYMPQQHSLYNEISVSQNVDFFARIYGLKDKKKRADRVAETIKLVNLEERRDDSINKLSGGMKQRVSLACAIVHQPPLLLLDEPTVGLDPELRANFWQHFKNLNQQGVTIIISSHTMDDAAHCDKLAFIRHGRVIAAGTPGELTRAVGAPGANLEDAFLHFVRREDNTHG